MQSTCHYCSAPFADEALRPFGPEGARVCFDCSMATDARRREAIRQLQSRFAAACAATGVHTNRRACQ